MDDFETRVSGLLRERAEAARPYDALDSVIDPLDVPTRREGGDRRPWSVSLLAVAAAVLLVVGLLALNGRDTPESAGGAGGDGSSHFSFVTPQVQLTADDFWIEVGGERFTSAGADVDVYSDPGDERYQTLELTWKERGTEMRLFFFFQSDGANWSSTGLRTYNGLDTEPDWVTFTGNYFTSPLGSPYVGSFDETAVEGGITSHLHMAGLRLQAFLAFGPGGVSVPTTNTLAAAGAPLVVPPLAAGLPDTGITWAPGDSLALAMATEVLQHECMASKGWDYPLQTAESWAAGVGSWVPNEVLGVVAPAGARSFGYHGVDPSSDPSTIFANSLPEAERNRFFNDLMPVEPTVDIIGRDGSVLSQRANGGCFGTVVAALNPLYDSQEALRQTLDFEVLQSAWSVASVDPLVVSTLSSWSQCVQAAVGETASTPNELARRYALEYGDPTVHEKEVAVADATCQQQVDLWHVYNVVLAGVQRANLGDRVSDYDELTRQRVEFIALARQLLADRGIAVPSLA
ncbi:MAG TPA: hypothetical protein PK020_02810 [Ilumatobacteraceae bacterium]|nr:hypothetical protein [Ilumatobacteraceae bacterium]